MPRSRTLKTCGGGDGGACGGGACDDACGGGGAARWSRGSAGGGAAAGAAPRTSGTPGRTQATSSWRASSALRSSCGGCERHSHLIPV